MWPEKDIETYLKTRTKYEILENEYLLKGIDENQPDERGKFLQDKYGNLILSNFKDDFEARKYFFTLTKKKGLAFALNELEKIVSENTEKKLEKTLQEN